MNRDVLFNQQGFTLIELLAAIVMFAVGMLSLYRLQIAAIRHTAYANQLTEAANLAQEKMEDLFVQDYDSMTCPMEARGVYQVQCDPPLAAGPGAQTIEIHLVVTWRDSANIDRSVSLSCIRARIH